jgi:hypothetical protein
MTTELSIKGSALLPKSSWLTQFKDLALINFKDAWDPYEVDHLEADWENIPFVIPKSIIILEKKVGKIQGWAKVKHSEIDRLLSGEFVE